MNFSPRRPLLQLYRLAVLVAIAWIVRGQAVRLRIEGHAPIALEEVRAIYPTVAELRPDPGERAGMSVRDSSGKELGYVLRTSPFTDRIVGYRGWTDSLVAFDPALRVLGVRVHASQDTREHVEDVRDDRTFLKTWNGKPWDEIARRTPEEQGIEGVSGATMTSMAMADRFGRRDIAALLLVALAAVLAWKFQAVHAWMTRF